MTDNLQINLSTVEDLLPASIRDMVGRIGLSSTLTVVERLGGITWRVAEGHGPEGAAKRAALADWVGTDIEELLHRHYRNEELYIPRCHAALLALRNQHIHQRVEQGLRQGYSACALVIDLAREYRLSDRRVWEILKQVPVPEQGGLFG